MRSQTMKGYSSTTSLGTYDESRAYRSAGSRGWKSLCGQAEKWPMSHDPALTPSLALSEDGGLGQASQKQFQLKMGPNLIFIRNRIRDMCN